MESVYLQINVTNIIFNIHNTNLFGLNSNILHVTAFTLGKREMAIQQILLHTYTFIRICCYYNGHTIITHDRSSLEFTWWIFLFNQENFEK